MGVCCIVFVIDGMLFEFCKFKCFQYSSFLRVSCYFQHYKFCLCKKKIRGGCFLLRKTILSHFTFYGILNSKKICPFTYRLNGRWFLQIVDIHVENFNMKLTGRWFPQIVDRDSGNLYPIYI